MHVITNRAAAAVASDWIMKITGEVGSGVSPNNFAGSESGTTVTITAGKGYLVTDNVAVAGYSVTSSADCKRNPGVGLPAGADVTCTITRNDIAPAELTMRTPARKRPRSCRERCQRHPRPRSRDRDTT
jgi:hypothetical protein